MDSPWGNSVVLPEVSLCDDHDRLQPTSPAQSPYVLVSQLTSSLSTGITFQTWFQAKGPGALLSESLIVGGSATLAPLIYINSSGNLVAGLFNGTPLPLNSGQTVLNWTPSRRPSLSAATRAQTAYQVGASNPVVSQVAVVDNTWHHLAFVVSGRSEALYVDGLLQGTLPLSGNSMYSFIPTLTNGADRRQSQQLQHGRHDRAPSPTRYPIRRSIIRRASSERSTRWASGPPR